mmetsp:Transcript_15859/g.22084  ORF Transcript_15859/g.22084 Transcript_15859/m.22084 type:complete len:219 (-) Transcript_15859:17-673(-)
MLLADAVVRRRRARRVQTLFVCVVLKCGRSNRADSRLCHFGCRGCCNFGTCHRPWACHWRTLCVRFDICRGNQSNGSFKIHFYPSISKIMKYFDDILSIDVHVFFSVAESCSFGFEGKECNCSLADSHSRTSLWRKLWLCRRRRSLRIRRGGRLLKRVLRSRRCGRVSWRRVRFFGLCLRRGWARRRVGLVYCRRVWDGRGVRLADTQVADLVGYLCS